MAKVFGYAETRKMVVSVVSGSEVDVHTVSVTVRVVVSETFPETG